MSIVTGSPSTKHATLYGRVDYFPTGVDRVQIYATHPYTGNKKLGQSASVFLSREELEAALASLNREVPTL